MNRVTFVSKLALTLSAILLLAACGGGGSNPVVDQPVVDQPVVDQPVVDQPVVDQPVAGQSVTPQPATLNGGQGDMAALHLEAIEAASLTNPPSVAGAPETITATRQPTEVAEIIIVSNNAQECCRYPYSRHGIAPVAPNTIHYSGSVWKRDAPGGPDSAYVYTDILASNYKPFGEVYPPDVDHDSNGQTESLTITTDNLTFVTHVGRAPEDTHLGNRGVFGEDKEFAQGHEISGRFDSALGTYICMAQTCSLNISNNTRGGPNSNLTRMEGWIFTPDESAAVLVPDDDYRIFGFWLRGPTPAPEGKYVVRTFADGSMPFTGDVATLTGKATYIGPAAGRYVKGQDFGTFTAKATLHASFSGQTISGGLANFMDGSRGLDWNLSFGGARISNSGFSGRTQGTTYDSTYNGTNRFKDEGHDNFGTWKGKFYGGDQTTKPNGITGTFDGKFDDGRIVGAFGANLLIRYE